MSTAPNPENREESREAGTDAAAAGQARERRYPPMLARSDDDALSCRSDADCTITCRTDGSCCLEQCGCSQPMSRAFLARLEPYLSRECGPDPLCPVAGCVGEKRNEPYCDRGRCAARKLDGGV